MGKGFVEAKERIQWAAREERLRKERQAQWLGRILRRNIVHKEQFFFFFRMKKKKRKLEKISLAKGYSRQICLNYERSYYAFTGRYRPVINQHMNPRL